MSNHNRITPVAAALGLVLISAAQAQVGFSVTPIPLPFLRPEQNLRGFCACQIDAFTIDGSLISGLDVKFEGRFHQRWNDFDVDGIIDPTPSGAPAARRGDSHLTPLSGALIASAPTENNNVFPSPLPDGSLDYGIGTLMHGAWGIRRSMETTKASVAYLVMPRDNLFFELDYGVVTTTGTFYGTTYLPFLRLPYPPFGDPSLETMLCVPEPSTVLLVAPAAVGLALQRRRRRGRRMSIAVRQGVVS